MAVPVLRSTGPAWYGGICLAPGAPSGRPPVGGCPMLHSGAHAPPGRAVELDLLAAAGPLYVHSFDHDRSAACPGPGGIAGLEPALDDRDGRLLGRSEHRGARRHNRAGLLEFSG